MLACRRTRTDSPAQPEPQPVESPRISTPGTFTPGAFALMPEGVDGWTELRYWDLPEYVDIRNSPGWHTGLQRGSYYWLDPSSQPWDLPAIRPCRDCGQKACTWRNIFKGQELNPREGPCSTSRLLSARLDGFPHWHSQEAKIYFFDSFGTCNGRTGANRILVRADAFGRMEFRSPLHCCGKGQRCQGEEVCVSMECPQLSIFAAASSRIHVCPSTSLPRRRGKSCASYSRFASRR